MATNYNHNTTLRNQQNQNGQLFEQKRSENSARPGVIAESNVAKNGIMHEVKFAREIFNEPAKRRSS